MGVYSVQVGQGLGKGVGLTVTAAVHALALLFLLSSREQVAPEPLPLMARVITDTATEHEPAEIIRVQPVLDRPQLFVPPPELTVARSTPALAPAAAPTSQATNPVTVQPVQESQPRFDADYLNNPSPQYPRVSRRLREQGVVTLRVYVSPNGEPEVIEVRQSSGSLRLDESALEAVRKWKFVPAQKAGRTIGAWVLVPVEFSLNA